ncbi:phospholipase D-like domain-containing protein [Prochlorothrix hollandica]
MLEVKVAIACDSQRQPRPMPELFHAKAGILEDKDGDRLVFNGSINETPSGWFRNWESFHVFTSWQTPDPVKAEETSFYQLWAEPGG